MAQPKKKSPKAAAAPAPAPPPETTTVDVGLETLEATPARLLVFLRAVGTRREIKSILAQYGYDAEEHNRGWALLHAVSGYAPLDDSDPIDRAVSDAIAALDQRDERTHALVDGSLKHRAPSVHRALLAGLAPGRGAASVLYFRVLLDRLTLLDGGKLEGVDDTERTAAREVLKKRGITAAWRTEHAELVKRAESLSTEPDVTDATETRANREPLLQARAFFEEWARIARAVIKRKDHLIALGFASRASTQKQPDEGEKKPPQG